jgi:uncharacterized protein (DUF433 family)
MAVSPHMGIDWRQTLTSLRTGLKRDLPQELTTKAALMCGPIHTSEKFPLKFPHAGAPGFLQYLDRGGDDRRAVGQHALAGEEPAHDLAGQGQAARALVGGLRADRVGNARDIMVLHVLADAAQFMHDRHADAAKMLRVADPGQLQDVRRVEQSYADAMKLTRITIDPGICTGKPCIRGLRFPVARLLGLLAAGSTRDRILTDYPYLEPEDIDEALRYAALLAEDETVELVR